MWWKEGLRRTNIYKYRKRKMNLADRRFQWRYFFMFFGGSALFATFAFGVIGYFVLENYKIFIDFSYTHMPNFVPNLEFERKWLIILFISTLVGMLIFIGAIALRMLHSFIYPMQVIRQHITKLTKGDWSQPEINIRLDSDYQDLVRAYNYFYRTLQRHSRQELQHLKNIEISNHALRSKKIWQHLVDSKVEQLNGPSLEPEKPHDSYHAS